MTIIDAGPIVALIDKGQRQHSICLAAIDELTGPLVTTWPAFVEAMYLLGRLGGWTAQDALWQWVLLAKLTLIPLEDAHLKRVRQLMEQYRDTPMDLADASLVTLAEARKIRKVFTLDRHFHAYRIHDKQAFEVVP